MKKNLVSTGLAVLSLLSLSCAASAFPLAFGTRRVVSLSATGASYERPKTGVPGEDVGEWKVGGDMSFEIQPRYSGLGLRVSGISFGKFLMERDDAAGTRRTLALSGLFAEGIAWHVLGNRKTKVGLAVGYGNVFSEAGGKVAGVALDDTRTTLAAWKAGVEWQRQVKVYSPWSLQAGAGVIGFMEQGFGNEHRLPYARVGFSYGF